MSDPWPRSGAKTTGAESPATPRLNVAFSDGRFMQHVIEEATRGGCGDGAVRKLEAMGFGRDVARVALHVSSGNERRALELCMSGLAFVGGDSDALAAPKTQLRCYICGGQHLTEKSLDIHLRACRRRFQQREAKKPPHERRRLLEASELPPGVECLERYYDAGAPVQAPAATPPAPASTALLPCKFCQRTFAPLRLEVHQSACLQRPRGGTVTTAAVRSAATPPRASVRLVRCAHCQRRIRAEVIASHLQQCWVLRWCQLQRRSRSTGITFTPPTRNAAEAVSSAELVDKGLLVRVSEERRAELAARLRARLPDVEVVGAFESALTAHGVVYDALRESLRQQRGGEQPAERELWHGTSWATVPQILRQGFNRSFAGRHGTLLGKATYFSSDPAYSQRFCDKQSATKALILARVLVGRYCKGCNADVEPPVRDSKTAERFDSTVDNEENPGIFAVFRDFQAVPLFLLEFN